MRPSNVTRLILALAISLPASAAAQSLSWQEVLDRDLPRPDTVLAYGPDSLQFAELWLPPGPGPHPVVVLVHGGCWLASLPGTELLAPLASWLRDAGVAAWNIEYRRLGHDGGGYPGTFQDVADGTDRLLDVAAEYGLDLSRVVAAGHSAGGHLALWLAGRSHIPEGSELFDAAPLEVTGVVSIAGIPDLEAFYLRGAVCGDRTIERLVDIERRGGDGAYLDTSPAELLPLGVPQVLVHGVFDHVAPPVVGFRYGEKARLAGDRVELVVVENAGHFELVDPWTAQFSAVGEALLDLFE